MKLIKPDKKYQDSFIATLKEYQSEKNHRSNDVYSLNISDLTCDFSSYIKLLHDQEKGLQLPAVYVSSSKFWLIDENEVIGTLAIRHRLTEHLLKEGGHIGYDIRPTKRNKGYGKKLLALGLIEAKKLNITEILITCDEDNIASRKIIEANHGILENVLPMGEGRPSKLRYWITL